MIELSLEEIKNLNLWQRLHMAAINIKGLHKDTQVGSGRFQYKGISHDSVVKSAREVLQEFRIAAFSSVVGFLEETLDMGVIDNKQKWQFKSSVTMETVFVNIDAPTERETVTTVGVGLDMGDKGAGKAQSYAKKYAFMLAFQTFTDDGDEKRDGGGQVGSPKQQGRPQQVRASEASSEYLETLLLAKSLDPQKLAEALSYLNKVKIGTSWTQSRVSKMIDSLKKLAEASADRSSGEVDESEIPTNAEAMKEISDKTGPPTKKNPVGDQLPF